MKQSTLKSLTEVELYYLNVLRKDGWRLPQITLKKVRYCAKRIAYHEAGHAVARLFVGLEPSHVVRASIIPDNKTDGRVTSDRNFAEGLLPSGTAYTKESNGRRLLMQVLAGKAAEIRVCRELDREVVLEFDVEYWEEAGTDLFRAGRIAGIMIGRNKMIGYNEYTLPILERAEEWTNEMLDIPVVWKCVKRLARILIRDGSIEGEDIIEKKCTEVYCLGLQLPKWQQRFVRSNGKF